MPKVIAATDSKLRRRRRRTAAGAVKRAARNFGSASSTTRPASTCLERALMAISRHPSSATIRSILTHQPPPMDTPSDCHSNSPGR